VLTRYHTATPPAAALAAEDVTAAGSADRHGIQAILQHRLVRYAASQPHQLQYPVRWEGDKQADTWEKDETLQQCPTSVDWLSINHPGARPVHADTASVKAAQRRARRRASHWQVPCTAEAHANGPYELPKGAVILRELPPDDELRHRVPQ
jgi:hypothetical protein